MTPSERLPRTMAQDRCGEMMQENAAEGGLDGELVRAFIQAFVGEAVPGMLASPRIVLGRAGKFRTDFELSPDSI